MDVIEAIQSRRTIHKFKPDPIPRDQIELMLECAVRAPNHKLTEPWQFHVVVGAAKERLAQLRRQLKMAKIDDGQSDRAREAGEQTYREMAGVPVVIVVSSTGQGQAEPMRVEEDYAATCCAVQNLMLAAWSMGIGVHWGTGALTRAPEAREILGLDPDRRIVGVLLVGYPAEVPETRRTPAAGKTVWVTE